MKPITRAVVLALTASLALAGAQDRSRLLELERDATARLQQASRTGARSDDVRRALLGASGSLQALAEQWESDARQLRHFASDLEALAAGDLAGVPQAIRPVLALLEKVRAQLEARGGLGLEFQGSYSQSKPKEPVTGGHASAMGPAPPSLPASGDHGPVPVTFDVGARLPWKMACGGSTKDHILESACGGVALFDYDGDGLLDIYLVTGPELTSSRERVPRRNALYRNLGGWKFQDV